MAMSQSPTLKMPLSYSYVTIYPFVCNSRPANVPRLDRGIQEYCAKTLDPAVKPRGVGSDVIKRQDLTLHLLHIFKSPVQHDSSILRGLSTEFKSPALNTRPRGQAAGRRQRCGQARGVSHGAIKPWGLSRGAVKPQGYGHELNADKSKHPVILAKMST